METYTLRNCLDYTKKIIELVKDGKDIDLVKTRSYFGKIYTIVVADVPAPAMVDEAIVENAPEPEAQEEADEAKKPVGRGRKAK